MVLYHVADKSMILHFAQAKLAPICMDMRSFEAWTQWTVKHATTEQLA
jgi:hypothetical protein